MEQVQLGKLLNHSRKIIYIFLLFILSSCKATYFKDDLSKIIGLDKIEIKNIQTFDEWGGIHGDGFILEIYELSENNIQNFISKPSKILPVKNEVNKNWDKYDWSNNSIDSSYIESFKICLYYLSNNEKINIKLTEIKKLLETKDVYYSFYYRPNKDNPQNVQLFILDVKNRKLYTIDQQM